MVSSVCVGTGPLGDRNMVQVHTYAVPEERALATLRAVFDSPINFLDTAAFYGEGESERRIGLAIRLHGGLPDGFVLATKADRDLITNDFSGEQARRSVERSLSLLGLDSIPLLHLHDPEWADQSFEEFMAPGGAVEALLRLRDEGVIGQVGIAAGPVDLSIRFVETGLFDVLLTHNRFTLLTRVANPLIDLAVDRGMAVLNAAPYASGILAKGPDAFRLYAYRDAPAEIVERILGMQAACERAEVPLAAAALQFSLRDPRITSTIVGVTHPQRIAETLALATHPIPDSLWPELEAFALPDVDPFAGRVSL